MINLKAQTQVQQQNILLQSGKANPEAPSSKSKFEVLGKNFELVKDGKLPPNKALEDIGVSNAKVTQNGKNTTLTFDINGKQVSVTGSSSEEIAEDAAKIVAEELGKASAELGKASEYGNGPEKSITGAIVFWLVLTIVITSLVIVGDLYC